MKIYTVEEVIDMGSHVIAVFLSEKRANDALRELEKQRIEILERNAKISGNELEPWMCTYSPYELCEYDVEE